MRILKFVGAFLGTLVLIFFIVFGFNLDALYTLYENSGDLQEGQEWVSKTTSLKGLTEYIGEQPNHVSVVSRSVTNPDTMISYGADRPRTMGTLSNLFLITTYARQVGNGTINPEELVSLDEVDRYQLPYIDASNHQDAQTALSNQGAINSDNKVPLQELVQAAIVYNDIAASDFLFDKLGKKPIRTTYQQLNLQYTDLPLPFAGLYITLHPKLHEKQFDTHFEKLKALPDSSFRKKVLANQEKYLADDQFHQAVNQTFEQQQGLGIGFIERRDILTVFPKSTAAELSKLMVQLEQNNLISIAVSERVKDIMSWPYEQKSLNSDFKYYGAIYDNRLGLLNGIDYGASVYSGEPFGQAAFFDSLQVAFWFHMSSTLMHQDYQQRLMWDPALRTATLQEIDK
jgi:hypothetical protein